MMGIGELTAYEGTIKTVAQVNVLRAETKC